ncbi:MAG: hypothetical protein WAU36_00310 [Cyclobacteriaceae bacterium]
MNSLENRLKTLQPDLLERLHKTVIEVDSLLVKFDSNFPKYTDHSINHTKQVFYLASQLLSDEEIANLNADEIYILSMACYLHDIGMCVPEEKLHELINSEKFLEIKEATPNLTTEDFIREIHHEISESFVKTEWQALNIPNERYATAIGLIAKGHRKVDISNPEEYPTKYFVKDGRDFVCLPYLAAIIRIADELDVTNVRTPSLLYKYYLPNNEFSRNEWLKHITTTQVNFTEDYVSYLVKCSDHNMLAALETQFDKIQNAITYGQKVIRTIGNTEARKFSLNLMRVEPMFEYIEFDPKGIKFSFDVQNVTKTFIGEDLYGDNLTALREAIQNSIDSCMYRSKLGGANYTPSIELRIESQTIQIRDNGLGMDDFLVENFFGRLGSSFYEQIEVKNKFDAIGQFGVGVFSYFLLCDFIEISTKTETGPSLYFRINNDPKSYFHFYAKSERLDQGTTLTLNLKDTLQGKVNFDVVEKYLDKYFRFIEFPITIYDKKSATTIGQNSIKIDDKEEIKKKVSIPYKELVPNWELIKHSIENSRINGECGLIINKIDDDFSFTNCLQFLDYELFQGIRQRAHYSQVSISQKGIFISNYGSDLLGGLIGNINLIQKERLNINRKEFTHPNRIFEIIREFDIGIIEVLFKKLHTRFNSKRLAQLTFEFLREYFTLSGFESFTIDQIKIIKAALIVPIYYKRKTSYINLDTLMNEYDSFILIGDFEKKRIISEQFDLPICSCPVEKGYPGLFNNLKRLLKQSCKYESSIITSNGLGFQKISHSVANDKIKEFHLSTNRYFDVEPSDESYLMSSVWYGKKWVRFGLDEIFVFNSQHPFISIILDNFEKLKSNNSYFRVCKTCLNLIEEAYFNESGINNRTNSNVLDQINEVIKPLGEIGIFYEFKSDDFSYN